MGARSASRFGAVLVVCVGWLVLAGGALAAVTPGWECVPTTAGQAVVSGGTGAAPSCGGNETAVLAPTYVSSGVGGKPTVKFSAVNVQIVSGSGATNGKVNGTGNLVIGYDEHAALLGQTGSHDLILGRNHSFSGFAELLGGYENIATGNYAAVLGSSNTASGTYATVTGGHNSYATGFSASVSGGDLNVASGIDAAVSGGAANHASGIEAAVGGGLQSTASATGASVSGGFHNLASDPYASISAGCDSVAGSARALGIDCPAPPGIESIAGGYLNIASGYLSSVTGGTANNASASKSAILGGHDQNATTPCQSIPATNTC